MRFGLRFNLTSVLWVLVLLAVGIGWWHDRERLAAKVSQHSRQSRAIGALQTRASIQIDPYGTPVSIKFFSQNCTDKDLAHLQHLPTLREVNLAYCHHISDRGIQNLLRLPELKILYLYRNNPNWVDQFKYGIDMSGQPRITDQSLETIAKIRTLKELYLWDNQFSDDGILQLRSLQHLEKLGVRSRSISEVAIAELKSALPNVIITD